MIALVIGFGIAIFVHYLTGRSWLLIVPAAAIGLVSQLLYARLLHKYLGGADPVAAFGARNLGQLGSVTPVPIRVRGLAFVAKAMLWSCIAFALIAVGLLQMT